MKKNKGGTNADYWGRTYRRSEPSEVEVTPFARWAKPRIKGERVYDLGCGRGQDTMFLNAVGVDPYAPKGLFWERLTWQEFFTKHPPTGRDTLYARWFFHAIPSDQLMSLLAGWGGQVLAEARLEPAEDDSHQRWPLHYEEFKDACESLGYEFDFYSKSHHYSPRPGDYPLLVRMDATKGMV